MALSAVRVSTTRRRIVRRRRLLSQHAEVGSSCSSTNVTTNSFFVPPARPRRRGRATRLPTPQWTGSQTGTSLGDGKRLRHRHHSNAAGIAVPLTDSTAFVEPTKRALAKGNPGCRVQKRVSGENYVLTYVGQDLYRPVS